MRNTTGTIWKAVESGFQWYPDFLYQRWWHTEKSHLTPSGRWAARPPTWQTCFGMHRLAMFLNLISETILNKQLRLSVKLNVNFWHNKRLYKVRNALKMSIDISDLWESWMQCINYRMCLFHSTLYGKWHLPTQFVHSYNHSWLMYLPVYL